MIRNTSYNVRPDKHTLAEINKLNPEEGVIVFDKDTGANRYWNGVEWKLFYDSSTPIDDVLDNRIIVNQLNVATTLGGVIDSTKEYFIDGQVDLGDIEIVVPQGGMSLRGFSFAVSGLYSTSAAKAMFKSENFTVGSGSLLISSLTLRAAGSGSRVFDLINKATNLGVIGIENSVFLNCSSRGVLIEYDQMVEGDVQIIGGSPSLELVGTWSSGYRSSGLLIRSLAGTMTEPIFKAGAAFLVARRFLLDINIDLPSLAPLLDFSPVNFTNPSSLQIVASEVTRDGALNASDANITPNIDQTSLASDWSKNNGTRNTFVGGSMVSVDNAETTIVTQNVAVDLQGNFLEYDLEHFDSPASGRLRHLGINPTEYRVRWEFVLEGKANDSYEIILIHFNGSTPSESYSQHRVVNNLSGGRDVAYYNGVSNIILNQNDFCYWQVRNLDSNQNCTIEEGSMWDVEAR